MSNNCILNNTDQALLISYEDNFATIDIPNHIKALWNTDWSQVAQFTQYLNENLEIQETVLENEEVRQKVLCTAISCLLAYCQVNITGPDITENLINLPANIDAKSLLSSDSEDVNVNIKNCEYLLIAQRLFKALSHVENITPIVNWWLLRCLLIHQQSLEENTQTMYNEIQNCIKSLETFRTSLRESQNVTDRKYAVMLDLEICQVYLHYKRVNKSEEYLRYAKDLANVHLKISGALGKRTQYQRKEVAQLTLRVHCDENSFLHAVEISKDTHSSVEAPKLLKLNDDLRLERIKYSENQDTGSIEIPSLAQSIVLCALVHHKISQPKDELATDELKSYLDVLLVQKYSPWPVRVHSILELLDLEKSDKRTVERAMRQCEEILNWQNENPNDTMVEGKKTAADVRTRLSYLFSSCGNASKSFRWRISAFYADLLLSLGLVKTALDCYLRLQQWEDVIVCYTLLELKHKAAEVIRERLDVEPGSVKLWCLLGDATDDISCYERAWKISSERSGKAQRHWGNNLYCKAKYEEAIPHLEKSLEINALQESVWLRLGYAALKIENWELAAHAYRNYTNLEQRGFEAWNNLAKAYIKLGMKDRAHKILHEALKCNYDNWQVWENMLVVSVDTGNFSDAIRSYERLLDLRGKHLDLEILEILAQVIIDEKPDAQAHNSKRLSDKFQKLMGRLSIVHPNEYKLWLIYASLPSKDLQICPKLLKAFRCLTTAGGSNWTADPKICEQVVRLCFDMAETMLRLNPNAEDFTQTDKNELKQQLSSVRLSCKSAHSAVQNARIDCSDAEGLLPKLQEYIDELTKKVTEMMAV